MSRLNLDFETCSECDLKRAGAYAYARHPTTRVMCLSWAFDQEPVACWTPGMPFPTRVWDHVRDGGEVHGWNVFFEWCIWNLCLKKTVILPPLQIEQCWCTMARAAHWGLPMSLDRAGAAIGATLQKDKQGHDLMMRMSRPRRWDPVTGAAIWWHETDPGKYVALQAYCARDVDAEREIGTLLPPLPPYERQVWLLDARMNLRGFEIDVPVVQKLQTMLAQEVRALDAEMFTVTGGKVASTTNVANLAAFANDRGFDNVGMGAVVLDGLLADWRVMGDLRRALELRKLARKTSTKKLTSMLECVSEGGRVRGLFQYAGAGRTLRWAGRLVQPQNLPRPAKGIDAAQVLDAVAQGADAQVIRIFWGEPLDVVASCLRACFVAAKGHTFAVCDFSAIEARVIAWLAGQQNILDVFASGEDVYVYTANLIGSTDRQLGKVLVLACGFGMGAAKFQATAATYGIVLDLMRAEELVRAWRKANRKIVSFWYELDAAARDAINNPGQSFQVGSLTLRMGKNLMAGALLIILPSGHYLCYREAREEWINGELAICYSGVNQTTRQWERQRTYGGKLAENVTQSVARHLLADAMLRCEAVGIPIVASIHDEIVAEVPVSFGPPTYDTMRRIMRTPPAWAVGLPLDGAGWHGKRYGKG